MKAAGLDSEEEMKEQGHLYLMLQECWPVLTCQAQARGCLGRQSSWLPSEVEQELMDVLGGPD